MGWCCMEGSCRNWRKEIKEAASRKRAEELWKKNKRKMEKLEQARIKPSRVISDALVVRPCKHSDQRLNRTGNTESTSFSGFVFLCMQRSCDEPMCCPQLYLMSYLLTYSTELSPSWETTRFAASQEIPCILWNPKVHYRNHKCPQPVPILSQLDPVQTTTSHFLKIHLNILSSHLRLGLPSGLFPSGFRTETLYTPLPSPIRTTCPAHLILLYFITRTIFGE